MPESVSLIFCTIQHHFILNTPIYSTFLKFIIQSGTTWQKLITRTLLKRMLKGVQHNVFSRTRIDERNRLQQCTETWEDKRPSTICLNSSKHSVLYRHLGCHLDFYFQFRFLDGTDEELLLMIQDLDPRETLLNSFACSNL